MRTFATQAPYDPTASAQIRTGARTKRQAQTYIATEPGTVIKVRLHSCHSARVDTLVGGDDEQRAVRGAQSAARSPARNSPTKSASPGVSIRLTLTPSCSSGANARLTDRCWEVYKW